MDCCDANSRVDKFISTPGDTTPTTGFVTAVFRKRYFLERQRKNFVLFDKMDRMGK
jgi:hypothetical protein